MNISSESIFYWLPFRLNSYAIKHVFVFQYHFFLEMKKSHVYQQLFSSHREKRVLFIENITNSTLTIK
jgi:hypothetical protein